MPEQKNEFTAWFLLALPPIIFVALHQVIPAIGEHLLSGVIAIGIYYCVGISIGIFLFLKSRVVRDHEWHRRKHIKKLQRDYAAEDRGVWSKADIAMRDLEADAVGAEDGNLSRMALLKLDGNIGNLTAEKETAEIEKEEDKLDELTLLSETDHVQRSTARVTGQSGPVESVQGVTHAQPEPQKGLIGGVLDKLKELDTSLRNAPGVQQSSEPNLAESQTQVASDWYSQEMISSGQTNATAPTMTPESQSNVCSACNHSNPSGETYCENCGNLL